MIAEIIITVIIVLYFIVGISQIFTAVRVKREVKETRFPSKDFFVSVIIPIKEVLRTTRQNLESVCNQDYPRFEVLFVAEAKKDPAYGIAETLSRRYEHARVLLSGSHDGRKTIAKCHNLIHGVKHAKGEVFLFGDSDVNYSCDWIRKMISPLNEKVKGRKIEAVTAPFFIEPESFTGKFVAISVSLVTFTASFTSPEHRFPAYASGASIAVSRKVFEKNRIIEVWSDAFNDDLVFADTLLDNDHHIYNQLANLNHPIEDFPNLRKTKEKLIRWVVTISMFGHRNLRGEVPIMVAKNLQFQVALIVGLALLFLGFSWAFVLAIVISGYVYSVVYRWMVGRIINERGLNAYYWLTPISVTAMLLFFVLVRLCHRSFTWEGERYMVEGRFSR